MDDEKVQLPKHMPHGSITAYTYYRCRCSECRATAVRYQRERVKRTQNGTHIKSSYPQSGNKKQLPETIPHGTNNAYSNYGCRCDECRKAHAEYPKELRARRQFNQQIIDKLR